MTDFDHIKEEARSRWEQKAGGHSRSGRIWTGIFILIVGVLGLLKSFAFPLPAWLFTWQMLLIGIGLFVGLRHGFRVGGWIAPIVVGLVFLANDHLVDMELRKHIWPVALIVVGLLFILRPKRQHCGHRWRQKKSTQLSGQPAINEDGDLNEDDFIDSTAVFGGSKKILLTKNFQGGDIVNVFGGTELNLTQADIQSKAVLEITAIFGGTSLIVPANWSVTSEVVTIFGGLQDKRYMPPTTDKAEKILVLKGTVIFGGIDIKSY